MMIGQAYNIPTVAMRFFNAYGPNQALSNPYTGVLAIFASRLLNGKPPVVFEDGRQLRDFVSVTTSLARVGWRWSIPGRRQCVQCRQRRPVPRCGRGASAWRASSARISSRKLRASTAWVIFAIASPTFH